MNEAEIALQFDNDTGKWLRLGPADDFRKTEARRAIIRALIDVSEGMTPKEIADVVGKKSGAVRVMLLAMRKKGEVTQLADGRYITTRS